jgi:5S rRNA maturation endonuclease (ribonuclease M5)
MSKTLDLNKVKDIIFSDIFKLLDSFNLEYTQDMDNIFMCCPCHEGSDNPNGVSISLDKQMWRCWTRGCNSEYNSDIFGFIRGVLSQREGQEPTFSEILKYVCKIYDVNNASKEKKNGNNDRNNSDLDDSNDFSALVTRINRKRAGRREYQAEVPIELPPRSSAVSKYFQARGFSAEVLSAFGVYDSAALRRAIIPINSKGSAVGYIGRAIHEWVKPKFLFSEGFVKTRYLYNYDTALSSATFGALILVEGQGDVWRLWEAGYKNAVGLFGKDVSEDQKAILLTSGITKLIVLLDNDQAGREAKVDIQRRLGRLFTLVFPQTTGSDIGKKTVEQIKEILK